MSVVFIALVSSLSDASAQDMALRGDLSVTPTGAASYTMVIDVPPGTAGMSPALTLSYNSARKDGLLGMGWSLGGLPQISRCPKTISQDGARGGVSYDSSDRFCLDGQRLVVVAGAYGADGAEYRTEIDSLSRVISRGISGGGPSWFEVRTKDGRRLEFGGSDDSRILVVGRATARAWAINKASDASGNFLSITYNQDLANGVAYPSRVDYTGNDAAGLVPRSSVRFQYAPRSIASVSYQAGAPIRILQLVSGLQAFDGDNLVSSYKLNYSQGVATKRMHLSSLQKCGGDGECLPPTRFDWTDSQNAMTFRSNPLGVNGVAPQFYGSNASNDFNGDGRSDVIAAQGFVGTVSIFKSESSSGGFVPVSTGISPESFGFGGLFGDFDGDGRLDAYSPYAPGQSVMWHGNGDGTFSGIANVGGLDGTLVTGLTCPGWNAMVGDFNGDGRADIFWYEQGCQSRRKLWLNNGDNKFTVIDNVAGADGQYGLEWIPQIADFNGDGRADLFWDFKYITSGISVGNTRGSRKAWISNGDGTFNVVDNLGGLDGAYAMVCQPTTPANCPGWRASAGMVDFNGDGKTDIFWNYVDTAGRSNGARAIWISKGDGNFEVISNLAGQDGSFSTGSATVGSSINYWSSRLADLNGDGKTDIFWDYETPAAQSLGVRKVWLSNGDGSFTIVDNFGGMDGSFSSSFPCASIKKCYTYSGWVPQVSSDFDGDGKSDVFWYFYDASKGADQVAIWSTDGNVPDLMTTITTGLGASSKITYDTLSRIGGRLYNKDSGGAYPLVDFTGPVPVVVRLDVPAMTDVEPGATNSTGYTYVGAKVDLTGRGFLGFRQVVATDMRSGLVQTTSYRQDFPFIGVVSSQVSSIGSAVLSVTENSYQVLDRGGASVVSLPSNTGAPYIVALKATNVSRADLDGSPFPTMYYSAQVDSYANLTEVVVSTSDGFTKTIRNEYVNDSSLWILGKLKQSTEISAAPN